MKIKNFSIALISLILILAGNAISYASLESEEIEMNTFIRSWNILGPIEYSSEFDAEDALEVNYLNEDYSLIINSIKESKEYMIHDKDYGWQEYTSYTDFIDLIKLFKESKYSIAYAFTEFTVPDSMEAVLAIGSDNGIIVYLNQERVFESFEDRIAVKDDDLILLSLSEGKNQVLIKIQHNYNDWGFYFRFLDKENINERLRRAAYNGRLNDIERFLYFGGDPNSKDSLGLTSFHHAMMAGRKEAMEMLIANGGDDSIKMPEKEEIADTYFNELFSEETPGASMLVSIGGEIIYHKGFGNADIGNRVPFNKDTISRIGSITKQFASASILKLKEEGKISLDDTLFEFIPDFPRGDEVTIHHLLAHTSGIQSYTSKQDFTERVISEIKPEELLEYFIDEEFNFDPGTNWLYNNSGYFLLGYIIEMISESSLDDYLQDTFFETLEMNNTGIYQAREIYENEAYGYSFIRNKYRKALNWNMSWAAGAGAMYSTVYDMYLWNEALFAGDILQESTLEIAWTPVLLDDGTKPDAPYGYGYGWAITETRGLKTIGHGGGLHGFLSDLRRYPDIDATIAVLQNCSPPPSKMSATEISDFLAEVFLWDKMEDQGSVRVSDDIDYDIFDDYTGIYQLMGNVLKVRREGNRMFVRLGIQDEFEIFPKGDNEFFLKVVDAQLVFEYDDDNAVNSGILYQAGMEMKFERLHDYIPADIDTDIYKSYAGEYDLKILKISIIQEEGRLFLQAEGQPKFELLPRSENEFFSEYIIINITFSEEDGKMKMTLEQSGMKFEGFKIK